MTNPIAIQQYKQKNYQFHQTIIDVVPSQFQKNEYYIIFAEDAVPSHCHWYTTTSNRKTSIMQKQNLTFNAASLPKDHNFSRESKRADEGCTTRLKREVLRRVDRRDSSTNSRLAEQHHLRQQQHQRLPPPPAETKPFLPVTSPLSLATGNKAHTEAAADERMITKRLRDAPHRKAAANDRAEKRRWPTRWSQRRSCSAERTSREKARDAEKRSG